MIRQTLDYSMESGYSKGMISVAFENISDKDALGLVSSISALCDGIRNKAMPREPQNFVPTQEKKEKKQRVPRGEKPIKVKMPKVAGFVSAWEYKYIKTMLDLDEMLKDYWRKFPRTKLSKEEVIEIWKYYHTAAWEKQQMATPDPRKEDDPAPGKQIGVGSKVIQIKGVSPAPGVGNVDMIKKDGTCKVQFFNHIKVLPLDHFALATQNDISKAKAAGYG
jgi:hypothetical protein